MKNIKNQNKKEFVIIKFGTAIAILIILGIIFWKPLSIFFQNPSSIQEFVLSFGKLAPLMFIMLVTLQVLFAPIPGQVAGFVSGYIFGIFKGTVYSMIGLVIGSYIVFMIARIMGRPFVEKVVKTRTLQKFDKICLDKGVFTLFLLYLLPALPDDDICYVAGLTKIKIRTLVAISTMGRFPGFLVLNLVGSGFASQNYKLSLFLLGILLIASLLIYLYRNRLESVAFNILSKVKLKKVV